MTGQRTLAIVLLALLGGCSLIIDDTAHHVTNHCAADTDCSGGAHCDPGMAMCVQDPALPYDLWLEVAPPNDPTGATITPVDLGPYTSFAGAIPLVVPRQVSVSGTVRLESDGMRVPAQITFTPTPAMGSETPLGVRTISTRTLSMPGDVDFMTSLPSRGAYDVLVEPLGEFRATVPPSRFSALMVGAADQAIQIRLPASAGQVEGDLVDPMGAALVDFEVLAVDRSTGVRISSVATTITDSVTPGHFVIQLASMGAPFDLVIRPTSQAAGLAPTYRVHPEVLLPDAHGHVRVLVPSNVEPVHWAGTVEYPESRGVRPVQGAVLQLHSEDVADSTTGVVGTLDVTLTTDEMGRYDGQVLPGNYTISITPTADEELGVLRETRDLHVALVGHVFHLPLRTSLGGTVQSPDGDLVRNAHVRATPLGVPLVGLTDPEVARLARPAMALSGPMGDFRLELDVGVYDIVVEPPDSSGFPWTVVLDYGIGGSTATLADVMQVDAPVVIESDLAWYGGGELPNAEVRAFAITPDHRAVMVGRSTSDAHGHARLLVPATLGSHDPTMALRRM